MRIRFAEELAHDARHPIAGQEGAGEEPAPRPQPWAAQQQLQQHEQHHPFQCRLIQLRGWRGTSPPEGKTIAQGTSAGRPHSSPLMKLARRPKNSPTGTAGATRSPKARDRAVRVGRTTRRRE